MTATADAQGNRRDDGEPCGLLPEPRLYSGALTGPVSAQDSRPSPDTRKATTTADGDTGLWFVPTGEILPAKKWSFSVYRVNFDYEEGFTDVSNWPVTFGVGLGDRAELFGAFHVVRRIDRDVRPVFTSNAGVGRHGQRVSVRRARAGRGTSSATCGSARRSTWSRRGAIRSRAGLRAARDGQDPDREG